jgi:multiple sugar transport system permease protein
VAVTRLTAGPGRGALGARPVSTWLLVAPALVFFVGWQLYPIVRVLVLSFTNFQYLGTGSTRFVGLQNFLQALADPLLRTGLLRAAVFTAIFLPGMIFIPMLAAILIDRVQQPLAAATYRVILLVPAMIPGPLVFLLFKWLYDVHIGPIDYLLVQRLHLFSVYNAPQWIGDPRLTIPAIVVMEWWWGLGYHTMFFLAGLAMIPKDLYEAARVDGAGEWRLFWHVTFPRLRPILLVLVVLRFGTAMAVIQEYLIFGGFNHALPTYTWTVYMWDTAFQVGNWNQGYAAAVGWIGTVAMLIVVVLLFWLFRSRDR